MVTPKTYPRDLSPEEEKRLGIEFVWTRSDGKPCEIRVTTSMGRKVTVSPGLVGTDEFTKLWDDAVASPAAQQAIWDAVPNMSPEERGMVVEPE